MRWTKPRFWQERTIRRFALFPIRAGDEVRWLEKVTIRQEWHGSEWYNLRFIDNDERRESEERQDAQYRGSCCAALRAKAGADFDPQTNGDRIRAVSDNDKAVFWAGKCPICKQRDEFVYEEETDTYRCDRCHEQFKLQPSKEDGK